VARRYLDDGFDVIVAPQGDAIPLFLGSLRPDLIATRGNEHVVVEVKRTRTDLSNDPTVTKLAEIVGSQPGWSLDVIVLEAESALEKTVRGGAEPTDEQLAQILTTADELTDKGYVPYAHVVAWGGLEAAMRRVRDDGGLFGRANPSELIRTLYSNGFLNREQFDRLREAMSLRNQVVHGLVPPHVDPGLVRFVTDTARQLAHYTEDAVPST
jgi:uncharacterized protein YutE (UPF0331/DUF86 family)